MRSLHSRQLNSGNLFATSVFYWFICATITTAATTVIRNTRFVYMTNWRHCTHTFNTIMYLWHDKLRDFDDLFCYSRWFVPLSGEIGKKKKRWKPIGLTDMLPSQIFDGFFNKPKKRVVKVILIQKRMGKSWHLLVRRQKVYLIQRFWNFKRLRNFSTWTLTLTIFTITLPASIAPFAKFKWTSHDTRTQVAALKPDSV